MKQNKNTYTINFTQNFGSKFPNGIKMTSNIQASSEETAIKKLKSQFTKNGIKSIDNITKKE